MPFHECPSYFRFDGLSHRNIFVSIEFGNLQTWDKELFKLQPTFSCIRLSVYPLYSITSGFIAASFISGVLPSMVNPPWNFFLLFWNFACISCVVRRMWMFQFWNTHGAKILWWSLKANAHRSMIYSSEGQKLEDRGISWKRFTKLP